MKKLIFAALLALGSVSITAQAIVVMAHVAPHIVIAPRPMYIAPRPVFVAPRPIIVVHPSYAPHVIVVPHMVQPVYDVCQTLNNQQKYAINARAARMVCPIY